jgi:K+-sensing histidine kinase KdpD
LLDEQLRQVALNAGHAGLPETAGPAVQHDPEDELVIDLWSADGRHIRSSHPALNFPVQKTLGFSNVRANGVGWRVYTSSNGRRIVQVAQRQAVRREIAENAALSAVLPIAAVNVTAPAFVAGRAGELQILFGNLINNAVRYTPPGGVVDVNVTSVGNTVTVEIVDTGCGIPHDLLPRAFDRFFRAAPADVEGSGLGLAIVKAIAERQGLIVTLANRRNGSGLVATVTGAAIRPPAS